MRKSLLFSLFMVSCVVCLSNTCLAQSTEFSNSLNVNDANKRRNTNDQLNSETDELAPSQSSEVKSERLDATTTDEINHEFIKIDRTIIEKRRMEQNQNIDNSSATPHN